MSGGPVNSFSEDLEDLIMRWMQKPEDDKLTLAEMVGVLEIHKTALMNDAFSIVAEDDDDA